MAGFEFSGAGAYTGNYHPGGVEWQHFVENFNESASSVYFHKPFRILGAGGFATIDVSPTTGDEFGVLSLNATTSYASIITGANSVDIDGALEVRTYFRMRLPTVPDATNDFTVNLGFTVADTFTNGAYDMCVLSIDRTVSTTNWISRTGTTGATTNDTGVAWATDGSWQNVEVRKNSGGTSFTMYVDGTLVETLTTNLPADNVNAGMGATLVAGSGGAVEVCFAGVSVKRTTGWTWAAW